MQIESSRLPWRWARNHGTAWSHRPTLQGLIADGCCPNEIFSDVFVTLGCVRKGLPAHNADQTFVIWIEDTGSGVSGRGHITYHSRKLVSQRKGQHLQRDDVKSRGMPGIYNDDRIPWPKTRAFLVPRHRGFDSLGPG